MSDFEPKSLTTHSIPNAQQSRNAAKSLSKATTGAQVSNLGMENVPLSSTNKRLGKSKAYLGEKKQLFDQIEHSLTITPVAEVPEASGGSLCCNPCMCQCLDTATGTFV